MPPLVDFTRGLLPELTRRTRRVWTNLGRPDTPARNADEWPLLLAHLGPLEGPFDWALCLGPMRRGGGSRLTALGKLVEAHRVHRDSDSGNLLARLASELLRRARGDLSYDILAELPSGFDSGRPCTLAALVSDDPAYRPEFWDRRLASSYEMLPVQPELARRALDVRESVVGKRVLLTTLVYDRPELAGSCVHLLKSRAAPWVGLLALAKENESR